MTKLEQLIEQLCPNGVEFMKIGGFAKCESSKNKNQRITLAYSITKGGLIPTSEYFKDAKVTSENTSGYRIVKKNWFVYSPSRIDVGSINYLKEDITVIVSPLNVVFSIDEKKIIPDYLLYFLQSRKGTWQILTSREGIEGTGRKLLPFEKFAKILVPVPPLEVQSEIVRILDKFTELTTELNTELNNRKKQYEYYRDELLNQDVIERKPITEIADTYIGLVTTMTKHYVSKGVKLIHNSDIKENRFEFGKDIYLDEEFAEKNKRRKHRIDDIITVHTGDVGTSAIISEDLDGSLGFATIVSRIKDKKVIIPKYLCYYLNSHQNKRNITAMIKGDRNNLNLKDFNRLIIPIPRLNVQKG